jgi:hypothetical protein
MVWRNQETLRLIEKKLALALECELIAGIEDSSSITLNY